MKALSKSHPAPGLELVHVPDPEPGPGEVLVRVLRTGICGTDLHIESWDPWAVEHVRPPLVPGHEFVGEVVELGEGVCDTPLSAIISGEGHIVCGMCRNCRAGRRHMCIRTRSIGVDRDGAFAQYVVVPESNVWVHSPGIDLDVAAIFDPFGNAVHTALMFPLVGEDVLITGAGPIGLMAAAVARHVGARRVVITDVSPERLALARRIGVDVAVDVTTTRIGEVQRTLGLKEGFDVGFEMSGHPAALPEMIQNLTHGGRVAMLGLPTSPISLEWDKVVTHMLTIRGVYGREMFESWNAMSAMLESSPALREALETIITDRLPARSWEQGFAMARAATGGKVVLDWTEI